MPTVPDGKRNTGLNRLMATSLVLSFALLAGTVSSIHPNLASASSVSSSPAETISVSPLFEAAERSYEAAKSAHPTSGVISTNAMRAWATSPGAAADLYTAVDFLLERTGRFSMGPAQPSPTFVLDAAAVHGGTLGQTIAVSVCDVEGIPADGLLDLVALFPGRSGLIELLARLPGDVWQEPSLLRAYGINGFRPALSLLASLASPPSGLVQAIAQGSWTVSQRLAFWRQLRSSQEQTTFLENINTPGQPALFASYLRTATPQGKEILLTNRWSEAYFGYTPYQSPQPSSRLTPLVKAFASLADRYGLIDIPYGGVPWQLLQTAVHLDPHGALAQSVTAYASIRQENYFAENRCPAKDSSFSCWPYVYGRAESNGNSPLGRRS